MTKYNKILAFVDIDNCNLEYDNYINVTTQLNELGEVVYAKLYGISDKKHREIIADASEHGYEVCLPMRIKKRGSKVLDTRIIVDIISKVYDLPDIDAVAVVCAPSDMVYLYRFLKSNGIDVIAVDNTDQATLALVDNTLDLGIVELIKLPKPKKPALPTAPSVAPVVVEQPVVEPTIVEHQAEEQIVVPVQETVAPQPTQEMQLSETQKLLREIERLRQENIQIEQQQHQQVAPAPAVVANPTVEQSHSLVEEAQSLLRQVEQMRNDEPTVAQLNIEEQQVIADNATPTVSYHPQSDSDLIKKIQNIRDSSNSQDDEELLAKIKRLLQEDVE